MGKVCSRYFFPDRHAILLGYAAGSEVFRTDNRNQPANNKVSETVVATGAGGFGRQTLSPKVAARVIANLDFVYVLDILNGQTAITDQSPTGLQNHCPQAVAIFGIAPTVARDPVFNSYLVKGRGVEAHSFWVGENAGESVDIVCGEFTKGQTRGFEDLHSSRALRFRRNRFADSFRSAVSDYNLRDGFSE
jgi:hypothetical protein